MKNVGDNYIASGMYLLEESLKGGIPPTKLSYISGVSNIDSSVVIMNFRRKLRKIRIKRILNKCI